MAVTTIKTIHKQKNKSVKSYLKERIAYITDDTKTEKGKYVTSHMCDAATAHVEFNAVKNEYFMNTGRVQESDVLAYQVIQSFDEGEVTPALANQIGVELAQELTNGEHSFIVATHTNTEHMHNHILFNSTNVDCQSKWKDVKRSGKDVAKLSDLLCLQHGLSVIREKKSKREFSSYGAWKNENAPTKKLSLREELQRDIQAVLEKRPQSMDKFLEEMRLMGYDVKMGKHLAFRQKGKKNFIRLRSLPQSYSEENITNQILRNQDVTADFGKKSSKEVSKILDMEKVVEQGKGIGFEKWAKKHNLRQLANTMSYLNENDLADYELLKVKADGVRVERDKMKNEILQCDVRLKEIQNLQKAIGDYSSTKEIYEAYKQTGFSEKFKNANLEKIEMHRNAKKVFDEYEGQFPKMTELIQEYARVNSQKQKLYKELKEFTNQNKDILVAQENIGELFFKEQEQERKAEEMQKARKKKQSQDR